MRKLQLPGRTKEMPRLEESDFELIQKLGIKEIKKQAEEIVEKKMKQPPAVEKQIIPPRGNPVYKAMHACNCSSRKDISKTHRIPANKELSQNEINIIANLLTRWIAREYNFYLEEDRNKRKQKTLQQFRNN